MMMQIYEKQQLYPTLRCGWVMRPDWSHAILYILSVTESRYRRVSSSAAIVLSLMNGITQTSKIIDYILGIFELPNRDQAEELFFRIIKSVNGNEEIIEFQTLPKPSHCISDVDRFVLEKCQNRVSSKLKSPVRLLIFPTGSCQTACAYCYSDLENLRNSKELSISEWDGIFQQAANEEIKILDISGGDPFARKDSIDLFMLMNHYGFLYYASTKCFITDDTATRLVSSGFSRPVHGIQREFQISVDSMDEGVAKLMVGVDQYPKRVISSISNLLKAGISPKVKSVFTPHNLTQASELVESLYEVGVRVFNFAQYSRSFYRYDSSLDLSASHLNILARTCEDLRARYSDLEITGNASSSSSGVLSEVPIPKKMSAERWKARAACSGGRTTLGITPNGKACLCEQAPMVSPFVFGDFRKQSLMEIWNSSDLQELTMPDKELFHGTLCFECAEFSDCVHLHGQCFRDNHFFRGKIHTVQGSCPFDN